MGAYKVNGDKMREVRLTVSLAMAVCTTVAIPRASAADLPPHLSTKAPADTDLALSWTGFYPGVNGGYGWQNSTGIFLPQDDPATRFLAGTPIDGPATPVVPANVGVRGGLAGGTLGYNWQFNRNWVATDLDWSGIQGDGTSAFLLSFPGTVTSREKLDWFGTFRGRLGYLAADSLLLFGTGGLAYGLGGHSTTIA
jgi:outer membrane immunogenic protein